MIAFLNLRARPSGSGLLNPPRIMHVSFAAGQVTIADDNVPLPAFSGDIQGRDVVLATHGFNVDQDAGLTSLANWETLLQLGPEFVFVGVLWPGDCSLLGPLSYPGEGRPAMESGRSLADWIDRHVAPVANSVSFISHSLGARVMLEAIAALQSQVPVRGLALMAGAVDDDSLVKEFASSAQRADHVHLLASIEDHVLAEAFPIGNLLQELIDFNHPYFRAALGHKGPRGPIPNRPTGTFQIPSQWDFGHGSYLEVDPPVQPPLPLDPVIPPEGTPPPRPGQTWRPSWSAAFVSARLN